MTEMERDVLGNIWRLCEQMAYAAQQGYMDTLRAQYDTLRKWMQRLEMAKGMDKPPLRPCGAPLPVTGARQEECGA